MPRQWRLGGHRWGPKCQQPGQAAQVGRLEDRQRVGRLQRVWCPALVVPTLRAELGRLILTFYQNMADLPPDQNNNPHLRAQLKRDRDATERFEAGDMTAKAARIRATVEIGTLTAEELEERKKWSKVDLRPLTASTEGIAIGDSNSIMDPLIAFPRRPPGIWGEPLGNTFNQGMSYNERFSERYDEVYHSDPVIRKGGAECVIS